MKIDINNAAALLLCAVSFIGSTGCSTHLSHDTPPPSLPSVQTMIVTQSPSEQNLPVTGTLNPMPNREVVVTPQVTGTLQTLLVRLGQPVQRGEVIAQISSNTAYQQVQQANASLAQAELAVEQTQAAAAEQQAQTSASILQAEANVRAAQAALSADQATLDGQLAAKDNAQRALSREQAMFNDGLVSQRDLESAQLDYQNAQTQVEIQKKQIDGQLQTIDAEQQLAAAAITGRIEDSVKRKDILVAEQQVKNATAALSTAETEYSLYTITSPLTGQVTEISAASGQSVDPTTKLLTIADLSTLQLVAGVPSSSLQYVHAGEIVRITTDLLPGKQLIARISAISPEIDQGSGTVSVFANIDNASGILKDNTVVTGDIAEDIREGVIDIPTSAIIDNADTGQKSVATIGSDSILHLVAVSTGQESNGKIEITGGLKPGDRIAISGEYGLSDGTAVTQLPSQ